jgi:excisionase family DNA binding protein
MKRSPSEYTMTRQEVATLLQVHPNTVTRLSRERRLKEIRLGPRTIRFDREEVKRFLREETK